MAERKKPPFIDRNLCIDHILMSQIQLGPLPKCKHGMISAICSTCNEQNDKRHDQ